MGADDVQIFPPTSGWTVVVSPTCYTHRRSRASNSEQGD